MALDHVGRMREKFSAGYDQSGMNLAEFPGQTKKIEIGSVMQSIQSPPFLGEKRLVIVKGLLEDVTTKSKAQPWVEALKRTPESTIVILYNAVSVKKVEKNHLFKSLSGRDDVHAYDFPALDGSKLNAWAVSRAKELGLVIDTRLLQHVVALVGNDLWQLSGELAKLVAFANGQQVTREMVADLVKANYEDAMFDFIDAVSQRNASRALSLLHAQRASGSTDFHLMGMLARQVRLLMGARSVLDHNPNATKADVARELGAHPFVAQKTLAQARAFDFPTLKRTHDLLYEVDQKMKTGGISADVGIDRVVVQILSC